MRGSLQERFDAKYIPEPNSGCWLWFGAIGGEDDRGYISLKENDGPVKQVGAHRISWCLHRGKIPGGMHVLHHCDVPSCVNPDHLWLGTHQENMADKMRKGRNVAPPLLRGSQVYSTKLTEDQAREAKFGPLSSCVYAKKFGVSAGQVRSIRRGVSWAYLQRNA